MRSGLDLDQSSVAHGAVQDGPASTIVGTRGTDDPRLALGWSPFISVHMYARK
jgi:hypothetical protein